MRRLAIVPALVLVAAAAAARPLKVSHQWAESDLRHQMFLEFERRVSEKLGDEITFRVYPSSSLVGARQQWEALRRGTLELSIFSLIYASGKVPELDIVLMPGAVRNLEQAMGWRNKPIGKRVEQLLEDNGIKLLLWWWGDGAIGSTERTIRLPEDVRGLQFRAAGSAFEYMLMEAGASITSMPSTEIYYALQTGILDSCMTTATSFVSFRLYEQLEFVNLPRDYSIFHTLMPLLMSKRAWDRLTARQQSVLSEVAEEMYVDWIPQAFERATEDVIEHFSRPGTRVHYMTEEEFEAWRELAMKTSWKRFEETVPAGRELLELALEAAQD